MNDEQQQQEPQQELSGTADLRPTTSAASQADEPETCQEQVTMSGTRKSIRRNIKDSPSENTKVSYNSVLCTVKTFISIYF